MAHDDDWLTLFSSYIAMSGFSMYSGAGSKAITEIEAGLTDQSRIKSGFRFPSSYREFLNRWDGGDIEDEARSIYVSLMSVERHSDRGYLLADLNAPTGFYVSGEFDTYESLQPLVFFATDEGGNLWAFDSRDHNGDAEIPVYFCDRESGNVYDQSDDFPSFIRSIMDGTLSYRDLIEG